jgi:hypothetical protein
MATIKNMGRAYGIHREDIYIHTYTHTYIHIYKDLMRKHEAKISLVGPRDKKIDILK